MDQLRRQIHELILPEPLTLEYLCPLVLQDRKNGQTERANHLQTLMKTMQKLRSTNKQIDEFTHNEDVYCNFIISEFKQGRRWLSYIRNGKGTLYALAQIAELDVRVWEPNPLHPGELRQISLADGLLGREINLFHTDRLTHFNVLDPIRTF